MGASAVRPSHVRAPHWVPFRHLQSLFVTSLSCFANPDPFYNCRRLSHTLMETLRKGGNVLFPVNPIGHAFDLLEVIVTSMESVSLLLPSLHLPQNNFSRDVPIYFISPVAASVLAFVNIFPEWLAEQKSARVYNAEEPFGFSDVSVGDRQRDWSVGSGQPDQGVRLH